MTHPRHRNLRLSLLLTAATALPLNAQEADPLAGEEDILVLPAFTVDASGDRGYRATNAISGTSLNTAIRDLPMPLEVVNKEFIEDLQAMNLKEALAYSSGVFTQTFANNSGANAGVSQERSPSTAASVNDPFNNTISIRGYAVPNQQRFGFRIGSIAVGEGFSAVLGGLTDSANTERLEVVRGPASLLYGVNVLSGVVNILPKEPKWYEGYQAGVTVGSDGFFRSSAEATGPLWKESLAYRVVGAYQEGDGLKDFEKNTLHYYAGQLKWRPNRNYEILTEVQYGETERRGIGFDYFTDTLGGGEIASNPVNSIDFRNPYNEYLKFGYDLPDSFLSRESGDPNDIWLLRKSNPPVPYGNPHLGETYRISGPDTYQKREELNLLGLLRATPFENFNVELGGYYTETEQETLNVSQSIWTNSNGGDPSQINVTKQILEVPAKANLWIRNPEILALNGGKLPAFSGGKYLVDDLVGFKYNKGDIPNLYPTNTEAAITSGGIGEVFALPNYNRRNAPGAVGNENTWNAKVASYQWYQVPTETESLQLRGRAAYYFETDIPFLGRDRPQKHTLTGGYQYTQDELSIVSGEPGLNNTMTMGELVKGSDGVLGNGRMATDPYVLRSSVFDYTPLRYQGEPLAIRGGLNTSQPKMGDALYDYVNDATTEPGEIRGFNIARSGWRDVTVWYRGSYAIYQGQFCNDRLTFIGGLRHDQYQVREREQLRALDGKPSVDPAQSLTLTDFYQGKGDYGVLPVLVGDGSVPYTPDRWDPRLPDELNAEIQREVELFRESMGTGGSTRHLFDSTQSFTTKTAGLNFRIIEPLSAYVLYSEGIFPNQGQRDGLDRPIAAEQTSNKEIGLKFDLWDGKVSGTVSLYQIERDNATWYFDAAPSPRHWVGGALGLSDAQISELERYDAFDARSYLTKDGPEALAYYKKSAANTPANYQLNSYGVYETFLEEVWPKYLGQPYPTAINDTVLASNGLDWVKQADPGIVSPQYENRGNPRGQFFWVDVVNDFKPGAHLNAQGVDVGQMMKEAFDKAMAAKDFDGHPIAWNQNEKPGAIGAGNNVSNFSGGIGNRGDLVTFSEECLGVDGQIIYAPVRSYQAVFTFSHQDRQVTGRGFNFVPLIDPVTGQRIPGTEYDRWIYIFGKEAFDDPTDPSTFNGRGVEGLDLSFVPEWNFSLWNKYAFLEGRLEGLELLAGVRWYSEAPTSIPLGGVELSSNRYPTPPTAARYVVDAGINYTIRLWDIDWRLAVKVDNVFDDWIKESVVVYDDVRDPAIQHYRRSYNVYAPRSWRFSVTATF